jgi:hypothetical protein
MSVVPQSALPLKRLARRRDEIAAGARTCRPELLRELESLLAANVAKPVPPLRMRLRPLCHCCGSELPAS